ncbi:MAG: type II toxin-antitoxin system RelE/ParE family toxin [Candidatus Altiarchaeia archaeon]
MTYEILFTRSAEKDLKKLDKETQKRIISALERIRITPDRYVRKIVGETCYRLRVGDYRIIMDIEQGKLVILVLKVGHRKNVYD